MKNQKDTRKKRYEKPKVARFPLRPEEAVLGFCKSSSSAGPGNADCVTLGLCSVAGS